MISHVKSFRRHYTSLCGGFAFRGLLAILCAGFATRVWGAGHQTVRTDPTYLIDTWETEDGLPENSATAMVQTPDGYLWFGTFDGLVRFDGVKFTVFDRSNTPELPSVGIVNLHLDRRGRLWISTYLGLVMREAGPGQPAGGRWRSFSQDDGWAGDFVRTFAERANGDLLLTTFNGTVLEFANDRLKSLPAPPGKRGQGYLGVVDEAGHWWVVQSRFVGWWDGQRWVETVSAANREVEFTGAGPAHDGGFWLVSNDKIRRYRNGVETAQRKLAETPGEYWSLFEDRRGNVWICTVGQGVSQVTPDGAFRRWNATNGLGYDVTRFVFEDRERNIWVGTSGGGLTRFKTRRATTLGPESGLADRVVTSICPNPAGGVWIGTYGKGVFQSQNESVSGLSRPEWPGDSLYVQSVFADRSRRIWVGTFDRGLWQIENQSARPIPTEAMGGQNVNSIFEDSRGRIWLGDGQGVTVCESNQFRIYADKHGLPNAGVGSIAEDRDGAIWVSNPEGVFRLVDGRFVDVRTENQQALRDISCLMAEPNGGMWLGSLHDGLLRWRDGRWSRIDARVGFPVNVVRGMIGDDTGFLWIASDHGIVRANLQELQRVADGDLARVHCQVVDQADGLASGDCVAGHQPACARDSAGRLWFATIRGVVMIDPARFDLNTVPPPVQIEEVIYHAPASKGARRPIDAPTLQRFNGSTVQRSNASTTANEIEVHLPAPFAEPIRLPPGSRQIEIHYTGLSFTAPEKVRFQTRLDGSGGDWEEPHDRRVARFYERPPGAHVFRVRAANNDNVWNEAEATLAFTVQPYYWQNQ
ncbi:MAG: two-component regulator propeller domain-containing protein [Verrucomicrobiota bacterium]